MQAQLHLFRSIILYKMSNRIESLSSVMSLSRCIAGIRIPNNGEYLNKISTQKVLTLCSAKTMFQVDLTV